MTENNTPKLSNYFSKDTSYGDNDFVFIHRDISKLSEDIIDLIPSGATLYFFSLKIFEFSFSSFQFKNINFRFQGCTINNNLVLKIVEGSIYLNQCKPIIQSTVLGFNILGDIKGINIINCNFYGYIFSRIRVNELNILNSKAKIISITNDSIVSKFKLDGVFENTYEEILFANSRIDKIHLQTLKISKKFEIINTINDILIFKDIDSGSTFIYSHFNSKIIKLSNVSFKEINFFTRAKVPSDKYPEFKELIEKMEEKEIKKINISNSFNINFFNDNDDVKVDECILSNIQSITIANFHISKLKLSKNFSGESEIRLLKFDELSFDDFHCNGIFKFSNITSDQRVSSVKIIDSTFSGVGFNPSFLHELNTIELRNSSLSGVNLINFELIKPVTITNSNMDHQQKIDFVRQLTGLMLENHQKHYYTIYRALEQNLRLQKDDSLRGFDRFIVGLNSLSNGHGTKPQKALIWVVILILFHLFSVGIDLSCQKASFSTIGFFTHNYFYYFKPITFISELNLKENMNLNNEFHFSNWVKVVDFIYKLLYAYLLYQFIAAFRKFNK